MSLTAISNANAVATIGWSPVTVIPVGDNTVYVEFGSDPRDGAETALNEVFEALKAKKGTVIPFQLTIPSRDRPAELRWRDGQPHKFDPDYMAMVTAA